MQECGVKLLKDKLKQTVVVAEAIPGFSFEKLYFGGLELINSRTIDRHSCKL